MSDGTRLDDQLCFALYAASRAMVQAYGPVLEPLGLTYPQYLAMLVLWEEDGLAVRDLGARLQLDSGTLTPLLKRLEQAGLVRRERAQDDERVVRIFVTAEGTRLRARARKVPRSMLERARLPIESAVRLRTELRQLVSLLKENES